MPIEAAKMKNFAHPIASMICPEKPLMIIPGKNIIEVNKAYCDAVWIRFVKLDRKAIKTEPEKPNAKLSALMVKTNADKSGPALFSNKKNRFVPASNILLRIRGLDMP